MDRVSKCVQSDIVVEDLNFSNFQTMLTLVEKNYTYNFPDCNFFENNKTQINNTLHLKDR